MASKYNSFVYDLSVKAAEAREVKRATLNFGIFFDGTSTTGGTSKTEDYFI